MNSSQLQKKTVDQLFRIISENAAYINNLLTWDFFKVSIKISHTFHPWTIRRTFTSPEKMLKQRSKTVCFLVRFSLIPMSHCPTQKATEWRVMASLRRQQNGGSWPLSEGPSPTHANHSPEVSFYSPEVSLHSPEVSFLFNGFIKDLGTLACMFFLPSSLCKSQACLVAPHVRFHSLSFSLHSDLVRREVRPLVFASKKNRSKRCPVLDKRGVTAAGQKKHQKQCKN